MVHYLRKRAASAGALVAVLLLAGCEAKPTAGQATTPAPPVATDSVAVPARTAAYLCPMGCEGSASNTPGKCPVCGMNLEANPGAKPAAQL
ncbi:heavy metal-binding domain-containing protein [Hymenobacter metallilatus]|uniref:Heavy metal binding domain-containing protein n=1 Tax=Hymenobacter metallilatus TaxID=2493666 RepID=A0A3R9LYE9_9BACT|nr:heavy metal-binding domain-containing protein [Hymenobacter metallilatus]RSK31234.1 hypothetical protein EI290_14545 [Hymenobacter metallilatus]